MPFKKERSAVQRMSAGHLRYGSSHSLMQKTSFMNQTQSVQIINFETKGHQHLQAPQHPEQS